MNVAGYLSEALNRYLDLTSDQMKLTAANLANQNTVGYTRQTVSFTSSDSVSVDGVQNDWGVSSSATSQRNRILEQRLQQSTSTANASASRLSALQDVESAFGLSATDTNDSSTVLGSAMDSFFASLTSLTTNPTDTATQSAVLSAASSLASAFNEAAATINNESGALNTQIATAAQGINGLTSTIAKLNQEISSTSPDSDAGTLEDQRQAAIEQLSAIVGVNTITTENNGLTLTLSSGAVLVSGSNAFAVSSTMVDGKTQLVAGDPPTTQTSITGGTIGGMMEARDNDLPGMLASLDQLANAIGTAVNTQNEAGLTSSGSAGGAIFSLPPTVAGSAAGISVSASSSADIAAAGAGEGANGTQNAEALADLGNASIVGGETASTFFGNFIGELGNTVQAATTTSTADAAAQTQAQTQRDAYSAVSLDDEAAALTQYQRAYEAAAKVFTIVDEVMASAINLGEQTTVA